MKREITWEIVVLVLGCVAAFVAVFWMIPPTDGQTRSGLIIAIIGLVGGLNIFNNRKKTDDNEDK